MRFLEGKNFLSCKERRLSKTTPSEFFPSKTTQKIKNTSLKVKNPPQKVIFLTSIKTNKSRIRATFRENTILVDAI
jgi:hypothetical protein